MRPVDLIRRVAPHAKPSYVAAFDAGDGLFRDADITTPLRLAHFCAQCLHETNALTIEWESGNYSAPRLLEIFGVGHHSAAVNYTEAQELAHNAVAIFNRVYGTEDPKCCKNVDACTKLQTVRICKARELGNSQPGDGYLYRGGGIMQTTGRGNYRLMGAICGVDFEATPALVLSADDALKPALAEWTKGNLNDYADRDDLLHITKVINGGTNGLSERASWLAQVKPLIDQVDLNA